MASTYKRGIDFVHVPTTLLSQVDASVGGKTGINSDFGKNLIGSFHSPITVLIDTDWLSSLSDRDFTAGLAEVVKCGFIADVQILDLLQGKNLNDIRGNQSLTLSLIEKSIRVKAAVVSLDFKENTKTDS